MRSRLAVSCRLWFLLLALLAALPPSALALTASQVYEQVKNSVVVVKAYNQQGKPVGLGSGVRLPSGDVITNYHVVKAGSRYLVGQGQQGVPATLKAGNPDKDLCLLTAPGLTAKPARLGKAARLKVGEPVYAVGAPRGLELSLSEGIVSQLRGGPPPIIQTTVAISKGSSGGGLFNAEAELVGITTFYLKDGQSLNFALPVEWIGEVAGRKPPERGAIVADKAPSAPEPGKKPKEGWANRAGGLYEAQNWSGLIAHGRQWTQAEPGEVLAWYSLGVAYGKLGRYREAIEPLREALRLNPDFVDAWIDLAVAYGELARDKEAGEAWYNFRRAYEKHGLYRIEACLEALRLKHNDADAWHNLGVAYRSLARYREAIEAYREAVRLKPDYPEAWGNLAIAYFQSGNRSAALEAVKQLRRYDPQQAEKLFNLIMKP